VNQPWGQAVARASANSYTINNVVHINENTGLLTVTGALTPLCFNVCICFVNMINGL
jgi:hypothetical protein